MIEMVGKVKIDPLTHELVDYLMGEKDGIPKEPKYTFQLYQAIGNTKQAIKIAITIANQEQEVGNYKYAHDILFETYRDIRKNRLHIPYELNQKLMILHSYIIGRRLIKNKDHLGGALMLKRVAKNISQFPTHMINILTSTVAECMKAGLKKEAQNWALVLMRKENRDQIPEAFKKKISGIALKNLKDHEDDPEPLSQCPF
jgi:WD repeat-containing protein 19